MANQWKAESTPSVRNLAARAIATRTKIFQLPSAGVVALFLFVGAAHAQTKCTPSCSPTTGANCLLVSNFGTGYVEQYDECGNLINSEFINAGGASEGIACLSGTANEVAVANNTNTIGVFNLATGAALPPFPPLGTSSTQIAALSTNATGTVIYAGDYGDTPLGRIYALDPTTGAPRSGTYGPPPSLPGYVLSPTAHDVQVGFNGNVFGTFFMTDDSGVNEYDPFLSLTPPYSPLQFIPLSFLTNPLTCPTFPSPIGQQCPENLAGMVFDASGNLWVSSTPKSPTWEDGIFEFDPNGNPLNFVPDVSALPIGLAIAPPGAPNAGNVIVANFLLGTVSQIEVANTCTGTVSTPGTCPLMPFFTTGGEPKYPRYTESCPNPDNDGYVEICKKSNPSYPVRGIFDFTVTAPFFSSGTIEVPVGECSGAIQVPSGTVTITETPKIGVAVSNVTAYSDNQGGFHVPELKSWTAPNLNATVGVKPGGVSGETLANFTNYAAPPGQLKICKIAGAGIPVGTPFTFTTTVGRITNTYTIEAGPADQGGFCELAGTFPVNTQVTVAEIPPFPPGDIPESITVAPSSRGSDPILTPEGASIIATIGDGITEVDVTNIHQF
jgi:hypothetical protein